MNGMIRINKKPEWFSLIWTCLVVFFSYIYFRCVEPDDYISKGLFIIVFLDLSACFQIFIFFQSLFIRMKKVVLYLKSSNGRKYPLLEFCDSKGKSYFIEFTFDIFDKDKEYNYVVGKFYEVIVSNSDVLKIIGESNERFEIKND